MGTEANSNLDSITGQTIFNFFTDHILSTQHHKICCAVKYLLFPN